MSSPEDIIEICKNNRKELLFSWVNEDSRELDRDWQVRDEDGRNALWHACREDNREIVAFMAQREELKEDAVFWVQEDNFNETPLHVAGRYSSLATVQTLVERGGDITRQIPDQGATPFHFACMKNDFDVVAYLASQPNSQEVFDVPNAHGSTPLIMASSRGSVEIVNLLVERECDVNARTNDGFSGLMLASQEGHWKVVEYLSEHGADPNIFENKFGQTPLYLACFLNREKAVCSLVDKCGANMNQATHCGATPFYVACFEGREKIVKYFVERQGSEPDLGVVNIEVGPNFSTAAFCGGSPVHAAAYHGHLELVKYLVETAGVDVTLTNQEGETARQVAEKLQHVDVVDYLERVSSGEVAGEEKSEVDAWTAPVSRLDMRDDMKQVDVDTKEFREKRVDKITHFLAGSWVKRVEKIIPVLDRIEASLIAEIEALLGDETYARKMKEFKDESPANGKYRSMKKVYDDAFRTAQWNHKQGGRDWQECLNLIKGFELNNRQAWNLVQPFGDDLMTFYLHGCVTQHRLQRFLTRFGRLSNAMDVRFGGVKSLYRIKEKMIIRQQGNSADPISNDLIWDLCRGMVVYQYLDSIVAALDRLDGDRCSEVKCINVYNRFESKENGDWMDVMCHVVFLEYDEAERVICEIQLCNIRFAEARKQRGGHDAYSNYRSAVELSDLLPS